LINHARARESIINRANRRAGSLSTKGATMSKSGVKQTHKAEPPNAEPSLSAPAKSVSAYAPEIEARRADYERLAECLFFMTRLSNKFVNDLLDLEGWEEGSEHHLSNAIDGHLKALWQSLDWYDARTLRKFYAEMRLHADQLLLEMEQARQRVEAEGAKQKAV
jgi:hypothetical protein